MKKNRTKITADIDNELIPEMDEVVKKYSSLGLNRSRYINACIHKIQGREDKALDIMLGREEL